MNRNGWVYLLYRNVVMMYRRFVFRLRNVSPSFFWAGGGRISRDFVAGDYSFVARGCSICPRVSIGKYVMFGPDVTVTGKDHIYNKPGVPIIFSGRPVLPETVIESDAWIGCGSIIMAGVKIGRGAIVGAGSVVTKDLEAYGIYAGVPARKVGNRFASAEEIDRHDFVIHGKTVNPSFCNPLGG